MSRAARYTRISTAGDLNDNENDNHHHRMESRNPDLDPDDHRLDDDLERTGYDADEQRYYYTSRSTGETYVGEPGNRYGNIRRKNGHDDGTGMHLDTSEELHLLQTTPWYKRGEYTVMFPFFMLVALFLLGVIKYVNSGGAEGQRLRTECLDGMEGTYVVQKDDTCWGIAREVKVDVDSLTGAFLVDGGDGNSRVELDCDRLRVGQKVCYTLSPA